MNEAAPGPGVAPALLISLPTGSAGPRSRKEDILDPDVLAHGESVKADSNDGTGACKFDFKASAENGGPLEKAGIDVCVTGTCAYTP